MKMNKNVVEKIATSLVDRNFRVTGFAVVELFECGLSYANVVAVLELMENKVSSDVIVELLGLNVNEKLASLLENDYVNALTEGIGFNEMYHSDDHWDCVAYDFPREDAISRVESYLA